MSNSSLRLFEKTPASFESDFDMQESLQRLQTITKHGAFHAILQQSPAGKVSEKGVLLVRTQPFVGNPCRPRFYGRFKSVNGRIYLEGVFAVHWAVKAFSIVWLLQCLSLVAVAADRSADGDAGAWTGVAFGLAMVLFGGMVLLVGQWLAQNDVAWLSRVISDVLAGKGKSGVDEDKNDASLSVN